MQLEIDFSNKKGRNKQIKLQLMALNCDFEGIDNDLCINDPNPAANSKHSHGGPSNIDRRKPLDGFTRSQYSIFAKNLE